MRIVFMGTPDFAAASLQKLIDEKYDIAAVFTQPDKPRNRGMSLSFSPVKELALQNGLDVYQPTKLRDGSFTELLRSLKPDVLVVVAYGRILPADILELPPMGCINIHGSLLPRYRGAAPIQWTVINGDGIAGVTSMYMDAGMDTGDIILSDSTPVGENETSGQLYERLSAMGAECLSKTLGLIERGCAPRARQDGSLATAAPMLEKAMGKMDFARPAAELHHLVCGMNPWPGAWFRLPDGRVLKVHESRPAEGSGVPGALLPGKKPVAACGEGALELLTVQPEGKGRMSGEDWLRGTRGTVKNLT